MLGKEAKDKQAANRMYEKFLAKLRQSPPIFVDTLYLACVLELSVEVIASSFNKTECAAENDLAIALHIMDRTLPWRKRQINPSRDKLLRSPLLRNPQLIQALNQLKEEELAAIDASLEDNPCVDSLRSDKILRELLGIASNPADQSEHTISED